MDHIIQPGQNADAFATKLAAGDTIQFAAGTYAGTVTINAVGKTKVIGKDPSRPHIVMSAGHDGVHVPHGAAGITVQNLDVSCSTQINSACSISGSGCQVTNVNQSGIGRVLTFNHADGLVADMLTNTGPIREYAVWGADDGSQPPIGPSNCTLKRFDFNVTVGEHAIRVHKHTNLVLGDANLTLPGTTFAGRINYTSSYGGAAITLKEGQNARIMRVQTVGPVGFGPNTASIPPEFFPGNPHPGEDDWESLRLDGLHITDCEFNVGRFHMHFQAACLNVLIERTKIIAAPGTSCLALDGPFKAAVGTGTWPASTGQFNNCAFIGDRLIDDVGRALLQQNWKFNNCTLNGKSLAQNGDLQGVAVTVHPVTPVAPQPTPVAPH